MEIGQWTKDTKVTEIMTEILVTFAPQDTIAMAAETLLREQVSGAPVVDTNNRCLGVLSISDLIRAEDRALEEQLEVAESSFFTSGLVLPTNVVAQRLEQFQDKIAPVSEQPVEKFMTSDVVCVRIDESLDTVVRYMIDAHVHRVLVVDTDQKLRGLVSTIDVLAALQRASQSSAVS